MAALSAVAGQPKEATLTERLNRVYSTLTNQANRIELSLNSINTAPPLPNSPGSAPVPMFGLAEIVVRLEDSAKTFAVLADGIERIA